MAEVVGITERLDVASARTGAAVDAVLRSRAHARQVEQSLGRRGLRKMAYRMQDVVARLGRIGQALVAERVALTESASQVAAVPEGATADRVVAALEPVAKHLADVPMRVQDTSAKVDGLQADVSSVLKGATPGPLLAKLEQIKTPLPDVVAAVGAAAQQTAELIAVARDAGAAGRATSSSAGAGGSVAALAGTSSATAYGRGGEWADPDARQSWYEDWTAEPRHRKQLTSTAEWAKHQRRTAGDTEFWIQPADPKKGIWADGLTVDEDTVVAVEAKYVNRPGSGMYEGRVPQPMLDNLLDDFDKEMERYANVIRHSQNPVGRLRLVTTTQAAADFLSARARRIIGDDIDIDVQYRPEGGNS